MQAMMSKMSKMYPMMILVGLMIVVIAFLVGYANSQTAAEYFSNTKLVRETTMMAERASMESIGLWMPPFKFVGIGFILGGIVMALKVIIDRLKAVGDEVLSNLPEGQRPQTPAPPAYANLMPMLMMVGELIFLTALGVGIWLASIASSVFANPLPTIDAAGAGSALLTNLATIHAVEGWLIPFKFFGISTEFLAIAIGLSVIAYILNAQTQLLDGTLAAQKSK